MSVTYITNVTYREIQNDYQEDILSESLQEQLTSPKLPRWYLKIYKYINTHYI